MSNNTFIFLSVVMTVFITIAVASSGYAAHYWYRVWREPETKTKSLSKAQFAEHAVYFGMVFIWLLLRLVAWGIGAVTLANSSTIGVFTGIILSFMAMVVGLVAGGVANGWFSEEEREE